MLSPGLATAMSVIIVILLLTYLVTSADSAVLIINTIAAAGDAGQKPKVHIIVWGLALTLVIGTLLLAGGLRSHQHINDHRSPTLLGSHGLDGDLIVQSAYPRRYA